jgi:predicted Zn-dependent peptidase
MEQHSSRRPTNRSTCSRETGDATSSLLGFQLGLVLLACFLAWPRSRGGASSAVVAPARLAGLGYASPEYAALDLGLSVLDRRLFEEIRDVRGLAYTTGASLSFHRASVGRLWITSDKPLEALPVARQIIAALETAGPSEDELAAARRGRVSELLSSNDTPSGITATLADWELTAGSRGALDAYLIALEQTTPSEVAAVLATYLRDAKTAAAGAGSDLREADLVDLFK